MRYKNSGVAMVLALVALMVFVSLAAAYATTGGMNVVQSRNTLTVLDARLEAESGMEFVTYQMQKAGVPGGKKGQALLDSLADGLQENLDGTESIGGAEVLYNGSTIVIPSINTGSGNRRFNTSITLDPADPNQVVVQVDGHNGLVNRSVGITLKAVSGTSLVFAYGIASKSAVELTGNASIKGKNNKEEANVFSGTFSTDEAFKFNGNASVEGDISAENPGAHATLAGNVSIGGVSANDPTIGDHIHFGATAGEFPEVDPTVFEPFATNIVDSSTDISGQLTLTNIRIKANTNPNFSGKVTLKGVVYIEKPNKVTFSGKVGLIGVVVTQDAGDNQYTNNYIKFSGNTSVHGVEDLPDEPEFATLKTMPGSFILAPGFGVSFTGNFGTVSGTMAADSFTFTGNAEGIVKGGIINYSDSTFSLTGNSSLTIDRQAYPGVPPGFNLPTSFEIQPNTYVEN